MTSSLFTITVTHPTNCADGIITIDGPSSSLLTYSINGSAESTSSTVPVRISGLPSGTHTLRVNTPSSSSGTAFTMPVTLASCLSINACGNSTWFWFWVLVVIVSLIAITALFFNNGKKNNAVSG